MVITRRIIKFWIIFFFPFFIFNYWRTYLYERQYAISYSAALTKHIGKKFDLTNFLDFNGNPAQLDFTASEFTIIDFWFSDCPPCLKDMRRFKNLLAGKDREIRIISISINNETEWKKALKKFSFLSNPVSNWQHLLMIPAGGPDLQNKISGENLIALEDRFESTAYPMYFVLDKTGTIKATPFSAADFLLDKYSKQGSVVRFLNNRRNWDRLWPVGFKSLIQSSGCFWILLLIISAVSYFRTRHKSRDLSKKT